MKQIIFLILCAFSFPAFAAPPAARAHTSPLDASTANLLRSWLADEPLPKGIDAKSSASLSQVSPASQSLDQWRRYMEITSIKSETEREAALNALYSETDSDLLRSRILDLIQRDPAFQSSQAEFIRKYGFYATGFNRVFYSIGSVIQGNIASVLQLGVDGVAAIFSSGTADAETRRAYQKLQQHIAQSNDVTPADQRMLVVLRDQVDRARFDDDMDRAQYALANGYPENAAFYAGQAAIERPADSAAAKLKYQADAESARALRDELASTQVGFPDRSPHYQKAPANLLRKLVADEAGVTTRTAPAEAMVTEMLRPLAGNDAKARQPSRVELMREWAELLEKNEDAPEPQTRWAGATLDSPIANPDVRLEQARRRRRGQVLSFIFVGPESTHQKAYKAASWTAQSYAALQNVGFFYIFEVMGRTAQLFWAPPTPESEYLDAQTAWLHQASRPYDDEARQVAQSLADQYQERSRFADARRVLTDSNALPPERAKSLDRVEAQRMVNLAEQTADAGERKIFLDRAHTLAPDIAASAQIKAPPKAQLRQWNLTWDALQRWSGQPLPCGMPGSSTWFDGKAANGEISMEGVLIEETETTGTLRVTYPVLFSEEKRLHQADVKVTSLSPQLRSWLDLSKSSEKGAADTIKHLDRLPFPFAIEGDAGASGVGLYPELKPIPAPEETLDLYQ